MTELKPCPFCGYPPTKGILSYGEHYVSCTNEDCLIESCASVEDTEVQAIKAWNTRPNPWHTGIPIENGLYAVYYYADNEHDYGFATWNGKYWEEHFSFDDVGCRIIAWQKIEPYKEATE